MSEHEPPCECPGPGPCRRYGLTMSAAAHAVCSGEGCSPEWSLSRRRRWREQALARSSRVPLPTASPPAPRVQLTEEEVRARLESRGRARRICRHRGEPTGATLPCWVCGQGQQEQVLYSCALHNVCTERRLVKDGGGRPVPCCRICQEFERA